MSTIVRFNGVDTHEIHEGNYVAANWAIVSPEDEVVTVVDGELYYPDRINVWDGNEHFPDEIASDHQDVAVEIASRRTEVFLTACRAGKFKASTRGTCHVTE